jgi:predicted enzyme related to lactoylglutathione lyase
MKVKFVHTNIVAKDWRKLAQFYIDVFGCEPVYPERDLSGQWIDRVTNIKDVHIRGIHLRLPGYSDGPTLELFQFNQGFGADELPAVNQTGFAHLAFSVDDVDYFLRKLIESGGSKLGELVEQEIEGVGILTVVYGRDPEGNIIEIQNWK